MAEAKALIEQAYAAFNKRDIDGALALMTEDVFWPKASEGGTVTGKEAIRDYWTRQWSEFDPHVHPLAIVEEDGGKIRVRVRQRVKSLQGELLSDSEVLHIFTLHASLISAMELGGEPGSASGPSAAFQPASQPAAAPESTAVRVALWRAIHAQSDPPPHVIEDEVGLKLVSPAEGWRQRPDMDPDATRFFRASIVARARFLEDLVVEQAGRGVLQYVILGAGLDSFAQRRPEIASRMLVFEIDQPGPQAWKRQRLIELGFGVPEWLRLVPVDFESGEDWWRRLEAAGFNPSKAAVVASTGVSMYLSKDAVAAILEKAARLAPGSALVMSFLLPLERMDPEVQPGFQMAAKGARASGTPFISFFTPGEILTLAREAGFKKVAHVSGADLAQRYFANRADGLRPPSHAEDLLVALT